MKRIFTPVGPGDPNADDAPIGGGSVRVIDAVLSMPEAVLSIQNGINSVTPVGVPVTVDLSPLIDGGGDTDTDTRLVGATLLGDWTLQLHSATKDDTLITPDVTVDLSPIVEFGMPRYATSIKTADYTTVSEDFSGNRTIQMNVPDANTVTVAEDMTREEPLTVIQTGTGVTTIVGASGVFLRGSQGFQLRARYSTVSIIKLGTNEYVVVGDTVIEDAPV